MIYMYWVNLQVCLQHNIWTIYVNLSHYIVQLTSNIGIYGMCVFLLTNIHTINSHTEKNITCTGDTPGYAIILSGKKLLLI